MFSVVATSGRKVSGFAGPADGELQRLLVILAGFLHPGSGTIRFPRLFSVVATSGM